MKCVCLRTAITIYIDNKYYNVNNSPAAQAQRQLYADSVESPIEIK